ncbi:MAG: hypothetical protein WC044_10120 [Crocinitomicaceae bacterium]
MIGEEISRISPLNNTGQISKGNNGFNIIPAILFMATITIVAIVITSIKEKDREKRTE